MTEIKINEILNFPGELMYVEDICWISIAVFY